MEVDEGCAAGLDCFAHAADLVASASARVCCDAQSMSYVGQKRPSGRALPASAQPLNLHHPGVTPFDLNTAMASGVFR